MTEIIFLLFRCVLWLDVQRCPSRTAEDETRLVAVPKKGQLAVGETLIEPTKRRELFTTHNGNIEISWDCPISKYDMNDIRGWMEIVLRKMERSIVPTNDSPQCPLCGEPDQATPEEIARARIEDETPEF